jgi:hypothetical protein
MHLWAKKVMYALNSCGFDMHGLGYKPPGCCLDCLLNASVQEPKPMAAFASKAVLPASVLPPLPGTSSTRCRPWQPHKVELCGLDYMKLHASI